MQKGVPLIKVKELLRHACITTTMRYAHLAPSHSREAVKELDWSHSGHIGEKMSTVESLVR